MPCTTILVGKKASYDGSTMIARNDDAGGNHFTAKKYVIVHPEEQPKVYKSVISHVEIPLPEHPMRYSAAPNAIPGQGIWAACGVNEKNVAMTATETITSNPRVLGADPMVVYQPAEDGKAEVPGGIGEEDIVVLVLPYINSAREGVKRLGSLLEQYGTYEKNGIAFQDANEIWWLETIGGHHWIARRVPDDSYVVMPNQLGLDVFDLEDYQKFIHCQTIDIVSRTIGDREYEIICDDEGLSKRPALVSAVNNDGQPMLVGNLIVMGNSGGDEDVHEISFDEIQHLKKHFMHVVTKGSGPIHHYTLLCDVEFI